jgi:hypothetical protein
MIRRIFETSSSILSCFFAERIEVKIRQPKLHRSRIMLRRKLQRYYDDFNGGAVKTGGTHEISNEDYEDLYAAA